MNKDSLSYKKGFSKGIEIYSENLKKDGYYVDDNNKGLVNAFKKYSESGFKKGVRLNDGQRDYFLGMAEGIEYKYKSAGTPLTETKRISKFEKYEQEHYYGSQNNNRDIDDELFGG